jgi:hypothetical protein
MGIALIIAWCLLLIFFPPPSHIEYSNKGKFWRIEYTGLLWVWADRKYLDKKTVWFKFTKGTKDE